MTTKERFAQFENDYLKFNDMKKINVQLKNMQKYPLWVLGVPFSRQEINNSVFVLFFAICYKGIGYIPSYESKPH